MQHERQKSVWRSFGLSRRPLKTTCIHHTYWCHLQHSNHPEVRPLKPSVVAVTATTSTH